MKSKMPQVIRNAVDKSITLMMEDAKFSLIWLHGLGDSSEGFTDFFMHPKSPLYNGARIRLLQAPYRPVTINNGIPFNSWYDIKSFNKVTGRDEDQYNMKEVKESYDIIDKEVESEVKYWSSQNTNKSKVFPYHCIYVGGFSQGCAMSLYYGLQCQKPIAGIVGFSGYLFESTKLDNLGRTSILLNHGTQDSLISFSFAKDTYKRLLNNPRVEFQKVQGIDHTVTFEQLIALNTWISYSFSQLEKHYDKPE